MGGGGESGGGAIRVQCPDDCPGSARVDGIGAEIDPFALLGLKCGLWAGEREGPAGDRHGLWRSQKAWGGLSPPIMALWAEAGLLSLPNDIVF